jgi:hypothetical protein
LALLLLHGVRYPKKEEDFPTFEAQVLKPLAHLAATNPLVSGGCGLRSQNLTFPHFQVAVDAQWLSQGGYVAKLAGIKVPLPHSRTFDSVLSQDGMSVATLGSLLESKGTTIPQLLRHYRSFIYLDYPADKVRAFFQRKEGGRFGGTMHDVQALFACKQVMEVTFGREQMNLITVALEAGRAAAKAQGVATVYADLGEKVFRDDAGATTSRIVKRKVALSFSAETVARHLRVLEDVAGLAIDAIREKLGPHNDFPTAVILYTTELANELRTGRPPAIPSYSRVSLWKNEAVCLNEIAQSSSSQHLKLRAGVTWCEMPAEPKGAPSVSSYQLADRTLFRVVVNDEMPGVVRGTLPTPILVIDRSGSMGQWCKEAVTRCVPVALQQAGYSPSDEIVIITFDSGAERVYSRVKFGDGNPTIGEMKTLTDITARGGTNMQGAIPLLTKVLKEAKARSSFPSLPFSALPYIHSKGHRCLPHLGH